MIFAFLATVIACFSLFGLSAYATEQRSKEMSIRKILGATMANAQGQERRQAHGVRSSWV